MNSYPPDDWQAQRIQLLTEELHTAHATIERLKRRPAFNLRALCLAVLFGWLGMPFLVAITFESLLPTPVRNVLTAANAAYSDLALGLQCRRRNVP